MSPVQFSDCRELLLEHDSGPPWPSAIPSLRFMVRLFPDWFGVLIKAIGDAGLAAEGADVKFHTPAYHSSLNYGT